MSERIKREIKKGLKRRPKKDIALLKKIKKYGSIGFKRKYYRIRLRKRPKKAIYRYLDIGKPKGHQLIRMKIANKWITQKVLIQKNKLTKESLKIVKRAKKYQQ